MARASQAHVFGLAWIPDLETRKQAHPLRTRSMAHVIDYRHALACSKAQIDGDRYTRVLYYAMKGSPGAELNPKGEPIVRAFNVIANPGGMAKAHEITCCQVCGCTEDRACTPPCAWASKSPPICTACA